MAHQKMIKRFLKTKKEQDESSERPLETWSGFAHYINPFFQINKKDIKKLYDKYDLTYTLFPITRSCEVLITKREIIHFIAANVGGVKKECGHLVLDQVAQEFI